MAGSVHIQPRTDSITFIELALAQQILQCKEEVCFLSNLQQLLLSPVRVSLMTLA